MVRVAQRPRRHQSDNAARALSSAGDQAPLRLLRERGAPGFALRQLGHAQALGAAASAHVQCYTGGS